MKKLYFINDWGQTTESHTEEMKYATPDHSGKWKELTCTLDFDEADYFIIFEKVPKEYASRIDYSRSIYVQLEPPWITHNWITPKIKRDLISSITYDTMFGVAMWWSYTSFNEFAGPNMYPKPGRLSCVMSNKKQTIGHRTRLEFLKKYVNKYADVDIFGWALGSEDFGNCFKGTLPRENTAGGYKDYIYSFVCENGSHPNYATARLFDCFLNWSIPIYWGCSDLEEYFPKKSFYAIDIYQDSIDKLHEISQRPVEPDNIIALKEARELTLYQYNIWEVLYKIIGEA